ncbi:hypothetical protein Nepgr_033085 [Nepenthes gracilis]|uniref:Uncharacterized protein n=1 Tax=Nepenthes gracilis TaxID=150966 RepID=A0AAD3Y6B2_NEPGR|nr:hypothetical protein Nepgr_033085 [Nepenthes gracilis]
MLTCCISFCLSKKMERCFSGSCLHINKLLTKGSIFLACFCGIGSRGLQRGARVLSKCGIKDKGTRHFIHGQ